MVICPYCKKSLEDCFALQNHLGECDCKLKGR